MCKLAITGEAMYNNRAEFVENWCKVMKSKRLFLIILAIIVFASVFATACNDSNGNGDDNDQLPKLKVLLPEHPYGDLLVANIHEFEEEFGITVIVEQMVEGDMTALHADAIADDSFVADVFMTRPMTETLNFLNNDWMLPLTGYDFSDYPDNTMEIGVRNNIAYFVPLIVEWQVLYYRKDLLDAAGLDVPATMEDLETAAGLLNKDGISGFASRGAGSPAVSQLSGFIYSFGGRYIENGIAVFDSPEAVDAITFYGRLLGMYGPPGVGTMSWGEIMALFQEGKVAMWTDASVFYGQLIDPELSQVSAENVGVAPLPKGPAASQPYLMTAWGMSISSKTENPDLSMTFLKWATSSEMAEKAMRENIPMARYSVWDDPSITNNINPEIVETKIHATENGYPYAMPVMTSIVSARELIGDVISESVNTSGTSPRLQSLATQRVSDVNDLLKEDGEYGTAR